MGYQKANSTGEDSTGLGVGAFLEIAHATSTRMDALLEAGFISQPMGGGDDFYLTFGPTFYIALGVGYGR